MNRPSNNQVRDLIYFDFDKAASIWSQFEGGLLERTSISEDETGSTKSGLKAGIPKIFEASLGAEIGDKQSRLETRILHHDLLNKLENILKEAELIIDLDQTIERNEEAAEKIRETIGNIPYIKSSGQSVIEDFNRILIISQSFNDLVGFINKSIIQNFEKSESFIKLKEDIQNRKQEISKKTGKNKVIEKEKLKQIERSIEEEKEKQEIESVGEWILDGVKLWINTFLPNRLNFRIYPFTNCPSFQLICNLKRECFVDQDLEHLLYGYGNKPNVPLAVFGLVTSLPPESGEVFNPLREFENVEDASDKIIFERAFRGMFQGLEGMEEMVKFSRYPNITLQPIAVYREFKSLVAK